MICSRGGQGLARWLAGQDRRQTANGGLKAVQGDMGVAIHGEPDVGMSGQLLGQLGGDSALGEKRNVGMAERVEVRKAFLGLVGYADAGQVPSQHFSGLLRPGAGPDGFPGRLASQVVAQALGQVRGNRLVYLSAVLAVGGLDAGCASIQVERLRSQTGQFGRAETGPHRRRVE
ncbi:MAG TPA: hypothetical protein VK395_18155 [Gemmataceae bacterium]|nr:hypothetical protein [Gemmataceae bacterium]